MTSRGPDCHPRAWPGDRGPHVVRCWSRWWPLGHQPLAPRWLNRRIRCHSVGWRRWARWPQGIDSVERPDALAALGLGGGTDAEVGLWPRLVVAPFVLDQPIVLGRRVIEPPEGIPRRPHPRLRFTAPAQVSVPRGRLLDGHLGQRERLQPLVGNGPTAQDRGPVGAGRQTGLRPLQSAPPVTQPLAEGLAGLLGDPAG